MHIAQNWKVAARKSTESIPVADPPPQAGLRAAGLTGHPGQGRALDQAEPGMQCAEQAKPTTTNPGNQCRPLQDVTDTSGGGAGGGQAHWLSETIKTEE